MADNVTVRARGPIFDGRARTMARRMTEAVGWAVAMDANSEVHYLMNATFRNPTPYYETQVTIERRVDQVAVHDRGIIYGPWLEGTSSRNRTTRFKGYANFRRATQAVQARVHATVAGIVRGWVRQMGGGAR